jgi:predicted nucleic acid-binding protein
LLTVLYDACVLYSAPVRDLLIRLALTELFKARWTNDIHEEWMRSVLENRSPDLPPLSYERLLRTRDLMNRHVLDCLVTGYEGLIPALTLPDPNDRHVLAAAIHGQADLIVTANLKDFPASALRPYGIEAQHPDVFIAELIDLAPQIVWQVVQEQSAALNNPPRTVEELLQTLETAALSGSVAALRRYNQHG